MPGAHEEGMPAESRSSRRACARGAGGAARGAALVVAALAVLLPAVQGDNFRFGDIRWASCYRGEGDFYDPKFPEVCRDRSSRLRIGFTITAAWSVVQNTERSMLQNAAIDIPNFINNVGNCKNSVRGCPLRLSRNTNFPSRERRIAYRRGISERVSNGAGGFVYYDLTRPVNTPDAIITCPVRNPPPELDCSTASTEYQFSIDRLSPEGRMIHARYSFEILFPQDDDYTVYFEGCCRPPNSISDPDIFVLNSFDRTFHLRTGVSVRSAPNVLPKQSFRWTMPQIVDLRFQGNKGDSSQCSVPACTASSACTQSFRVQGYHPSESLRTFGSGVTFRLANVYELGLYKCVEHAPASAPVPQIPNNWQFLPARCPDYVDPSNPGFFLPFSDPNRLSVTPDGIVTFSVAQFGVWTLTLMADVYVLDPATNTNRLLSTPVDLLVRVSQADGNLNQPDATIRRDLYLNGVQGASMAALRNAPISIQCGRTTFNVPRQDGSVLTSTDALTMSFRDLDSNHAGGLCSNEPQFLQWISQVHELPKGVKVGNVTRVFRTGNIDLGEGSVPLTWRPQCEDLSQVGLFQWCFFARDQFAGAGFSQLVSAPSPVTILGPGNTVENPSCVFIRSLPPPVSNPSPTFEGPTTFQQCSGDCCRCCGDIGCACDISGQPCQQCQRAFAEARQLFKYPIYARDTDPFTNVTFALTFPTGDQAYRDFGFLTNTLLTNGVALPTLRPTKYGCGGRSYDSCVSNPTNTSDASSEIVWDLTANAFVCYNGNIKTQTVCNGEADLATCGAGQCRPNRLEIEAFKVCYQAVEVVPPFVSRTEWQNTYGTTPDNSSCLVCFLLNAANEPKWLDDSGDPDKPRCESATGSAFNLAVGETRAIRLEAQDTAPNQNNFRIAVLADPGAPNGAHLTPTVSLGGSRFGRDFVFTPQLGQENTEYTVCFQATNDNNLNSVRCCPVLRVNSGEPLWGLTKVFDARQNCYVGCPWSNAGGGVCLDEANDNGFCASDGVVDVTVGCNYKMSVAVTVNNANYNLRMRVKELPDCPTCVPGGIAVRACPAPMGGVMMAPNMTATHHEPCCGNHLCDGAETGQNCPQDCPPDDATLEPNPAFPDTPTRAVFSFTPTRVQQGRRLLTCIEVYDALNGIAVINQERVPAQGIGPSLCIVYNVESCRYCVPAGATLKSIAKHYLLNVDWLRLYNANPHIPNPNSLIPSDLSDEEPIFIGPRYTVESGDTLLSIAATMRTTVKSILENNPTVTPDGMLMVGSKLCLLLCSAAN